MCKKMQFVAGNHRRCQVVQFRYNIVNFDKKRSVPNEVLSEVKVSVVKMIIITRDDCMQEKNPKWMFGANRKLCPSGSMFAFTQHSLVMPKNDLSYRMSVQRRLIRLGGCSGRSESSLGAHATLLVLS